MYSSENRALWQKMLLVIMLCLPAASFAGEPSVSSGGRYMVVTPHPLATKAGVSVLKSGGSAADAAIAAELVLGLVTPYETGPGGNGFALYYDARQRALSSLDAGAAAPSQAGKYLFIGEDGKPVSEEEARVGGRAVGVPGVVKLLGALHELGGKLEWKDLFGPAVWLAENGFEISQEFAQVSAEHRRYLGRYMIGRQYFFTAFGNPREPGERLVNPQYAQTLKLLMEQGADAFYKADPAREIVMAVQDRAYNNRGLLSLEDLAEYEVLRQVHLCLPYRLWSVCGISAPAGGLTVLGTLGILQAYYDGREDDYESQLDWHVILEAGRLAYADRYAHLADPGYMRFAAAELVSPDYLRQRAALIRQDAAMSHVPAGFPENANIVPEEIRDIPGTSQISIIDSEGNAVSMTTSLGGQFGAHLMAGGYVLNAALAGFAFHGATGDEVSVNQVAGGKRPRSPLSPLMVFDREGKPVLISGTSGGEPIPSMLVQQLVSVLDWGFSLERSVTQPLIALREDVIVEEGSGQLAHSLEKRGHTVRTEVIDSGFMSILVRGGRLTGVAEGGSASGE